MSWLDKVGDAFNAVKDEVKVGGAWMASRWDDYQKWRSDAETRGDQAYASGQMDPISKGFEWLDRNVVEPTFGAVGGAIGSAAGTAATGLEAAYSYGVARPISTVMQANAAADASSRQGDVAGKPQFASVGNYWSTFLDPSTWDTAWGRSADVSPGQATALGLAPAGAVTAAGLDPNNRFDPATDAQRHKFFYDTWQGQVSSGAVDLFLNLGIDPAVIAGKGIKSATAAQRTVQDAADATAVVKAAAGDAAGATSRQQKLGDAMETLIAKTDGLAAHEIAMLPEFKDSTDAAALAYLFSRANETHADDILKRHDVKRSLWGAVLGDQDSVKILHGERSDLLRELHQMTQPPMQARHAKTVYEAFTEQSALEARRAIGAAPGATVAARNPWEKGLSEFNGPAMRAFDEALVKNIEDTLTHLDRVIAARGSSGTVRAGTWDRIAHTLNQDALSTTTIRSGVGARPVRVVQGAAGARLPGHVSTKDSNVGFDQLRETLGQAPVGPNVRKAILDKYVKAGTVGERQRIVEQAERVIVESIGAKYGLDRKAVEVLLAQGAARRSAYANILKTRLYSAAPDATHVGMVDAATDEGYAISRPLLQSQLEDNVAIVDPRRLDKAVRQLSGNRLFEQAIRKHWVGDMVLDKADSLATIAYAALDKSTMVWRDSMLMRAAYPLRVQADSQLRLMAYMGVVPYVLQAGKVAKVAAKYAKPEHGTGFDTGKRFWNLFDPEHQKAAVDEMLDVLKVPEDLREMATRHLLEDGGSMATMVDALAVHKLGKMRATGNWGYVDPADERWAEAYKRAVDRQIRNSPTAMRILAEERAGTLTMERMRRLVRQDPQLRAEWLNLRGGYDDVDEWLAKIGGHLAHYLPTADLREMALRGQIDDADIARVFGGAQRADAAAGARQALRMRVHGENYSPTEAGRGWKEWEGIRSRYYEAVSTMPEVMLARAPLFAHAYNERLREVMTRLGDRADLDQARVTAARLARRDVAKTLFDTADSSDLSMTLKHASPFFGAWEDMMKKWGKLIYDKPWLLERGRQAWTAPNDAGWVVDSNGNHLDGEGNRWVANPDGSWRKLDPTKDASIIGDGEYLTLPLRVLPGGRALAGRTGAGELRFNKKSFNMVFQGEPWWLPGMGPVVQVPTNYITLRAFPDLADSPVGKYLMPYGVTDKSLRDQVSPAWMRNANNAFGTTRDHAAIYSMLLAQETSRYTAGERATMPKPGEVETMTRNWFIMRAVTAFASPVSAQPSAKLAFYQEEAHRYRQQYGGEWEQKFYQDHPQFFSMAISLDVNESGIQATDNSWNALEDPKVRQLVSEHPSMGWVFLGAQALVQPDVEGGAYSRDVATALRAAQYGYGNTDTFRGQKTPAEAMQDIQRQEGWIKYQKLMTLIQQKLDERGITIRQKGAADLRTVRDTYVESMKGVNEAWYTDYMDGSQKRLPEFFASVRAAQKNPQIASRSDMKALDAYLQGRTAIKEALAGREFKSLEKNPDLAERWDAFTGALVKADIGFEQMWNRVLERDDLKGDY